jgi:hypothetical protein
MNLSVKYEEFGASDQLLGHRGPMARRRAQAGFRVEAILRSPPPQSKIDREICRISQAAVTFEIPLSDELILSPRFALHELKQEDKA